MSHLPTPEIGPWIEAVIRVTSLARWRALADTVFGWHPLYEGVIDPAQLEAWQFARGASGLQAVYGCGDETQGRVRFIEVADGMAAQVRAAAMPWDTGGCFALMVRALDVGATSQALFDAGWTSFTDVMTIEYFGKTIRTVILRGPDGVCLSVYERVSPPLPGWGHVRRVSQPFNVMQCVADKDAARDFHRDALGFGAFFDGDHVRTEPVDSNFGVPRNLTTQLVMRAAIMHPAPSVLDGERANGRVELIEWAGLEGRDLSTRVGFQARGIASIRWPVADVDALAARLRARGGTPFAGPRRLDLPPYGPCAVLALRLKDGGIYEFVQRLPG